jgi:hypothetical protein
MSNFQNFVANTTPPAAACCVGDQIKKDGPWQPAHGKSSLITAVGSFFNMWAKHFVLTLIAAVGCTCVSGQFAPSCGCSTGVGRQRNATGTGRLGAGAKIQIGASGSRREGDYGL